MKTIGAFEAKTHLSRLLEDVLRGEVITITKHGKPAALLVPVSSQKPNGDDLVARFERLRRSAPKVSRREIREWVEEGRR